MPSANNGGHGAKKSRFIACRFVHRYVTGIASYAAEATEDSEQLRLDNSPPLIAETLEAESVGSASPAPPPTVGVDIGPIGRRRGAVTFPARGA